MTQKHISRRRFLQVSAFATAGAAAEMPASQYNEAPMLAEMVANGELLPVDERLPSNPMVIEPWEEIGQYGGT